MMKSLLLSALLGGTSALGQTPNSVVSGQIRYQDGKPAASIQVFLTRPLIPGQIIGQTSGQTNADGVFRIDRVAAGQYQVVAAAIQTTIFPGTTDAATALVLLSNLATPFGATRNGTYFPGTVDATKATTIDVAPGAIVENLNFALAAAPAPGRDRAVVTIHGKIVVEGGGKPTLSLGLLSLFFSDGPDNRAADVTFLDARQPVMASTRFEPPTSKNTLNSVNSVLPLPSFPDGAFHIYLLEGLYRVLQPAPPEGSQPAHAGGDGYYIKGLSFGATDLMKSLMAIRGPIKDELVITLAKCSAASKDEPLCLYEKRH